MAPRMRNTGPHGASVRVAIDTGPLLGHRTGIGLTVAMLLESFGRLDDGPVTVPYVLSFRGDLPPGTTRLPLPALVAHRLWSRSQHPRLDHWLGDVDVVHGTNHVVPPSRRPRLVSVYDTWFLTHPADVHPHVARMADVLRCSVRAGAVVHTSSHASAERLREILGAVRRDLRVEVVPLGTPPRSPASDADLPEVLSGRRWVLALGTRERRKNLPALVRAFGRADTPDDVTLVIAGAPGNDDDAITTAIDALAEPSRRRVVLLGAVSDGRKAALLQGATVLAYPSLDEGFGLPLLEAMDAGAAVVASSAGSIPEVAGDAALLSAPGDADGLAGSLHRVLTDDSLHRDLVDRGRRRAAAFTWTGTATAMTSLYSALAMEARS